MRVLLVTDDTRYADELASAASFRGVDLAQAAVGDDLDARVALHVPNVVVLDAHDSLARTSRTATVFAALHPRIATVLIAKRAPERSVGSVLVFDKWFSAERLLRELERAYLRLGPRGEMRRLAGE